MRNYPVNNYYSYRIPNIFNNIHHLQLVDACVSLELLQYLLTNLRLGSVSLDCCEFFTQEARLSAILPESLVSLHFGECSLRLINYDEAPTTESIAVGNLNSHLFKLEPQNINNLEYFAFSAQSIDRISNVNEFLAYNPQLKSVTGLYRSLDLVNLPVIHNLFRVDHLKIKENITNTAIDQHFTEFDNLKSLSISQSENIQHITQLLESCPNIKYLEIKHINEYDYYTTLYQILSTMKLKKISISFQESSSASFSIAAPIIGELEILEFSRLPPSKFDFDTLDGLTKLITIKFINLDYKFCLKTPPLVENEKFKCLCYPTSVVYHKFSKLLKHLSERDQWSNSVENSVENSVVEN
ncbi:hypothetical protein CONCODRAFT_165589 [Conidiobolus coronatus NRRL 28638]|uniref:RNI-like protein n=1 Tax=Conidiobolus coronatus (strain ATCC 28846 / CBS 209.66 / NRRL 28638) TaxID=796925 RepID=A0A137P3S4_CONC2|nr:hypothetical protein CONCODRAFT_165589 [Conidiobolus coronatus NRRL 28638]|eukprot:KXN69544.1 hypothetical protein CONCODRAFT_165589 [Conidiobolus coronatus NRRL 28638]